MTRAFVAAAAAATISLGSCVLWGLTDTSELCRVPLAAVRHSGGVISGSITAAQDRLFVLDGGAGLAIFDIADPLRTRELARYAPGTDVLTAVATEGGIAYAGTEGGGLLVLDISGEADPALVARLPVHDSSGDRSFPVAAVVATAGALLTVDVGDEGPLLVCWDRTDPADPRPIAEISLPGEDWAYDGGFVYAVGPEGLLVCDVRDIAAPTIVGTLPIRTANRIAAAGNVLVTSRARTESRTNAFVTIDVSDRAAPEILAVEEVDGSMVSGGEGWVYFWNGTWTGVPLRRWDISDPTRPRRDVGFFLGDASYILDVAEYDGRVYVRTEDSVYVHGSRLR